MVSNFYLVFVTILLEVSEIIIASSSSSSSGSSSSGGVAQNDGRLSQYALHANELWESNLFILPYTKSYNPTSRLCAKYSSRFCTMGFYTHARKDDRLPHIEDFQAFYELIMGVYRQINWFSFSSNYPEERGRCCKNQLGIYRSFGQIQGMSPHTYMASVMDYESNGRQINLIKSKYNKHLCVNVISVVGFGPGEFKMKASHRTAFAIFVEDVKSFHIFSYDTIRETLTFDWFKTNVMCQEQSWVCELFPNKNLSPRNSASDSASSDDL